jgi:Transposase and inactivated derivatives
MQTTTREERGQAIAELGGQVKRIERYIYSVKSQSGNGEYRVNKIDDIWVCECPDNQIRHLICKHIYAVDFSNKMRITVEANKPTPFVVSELTAQVCKYCGSSNLKKYGIRHNKSGDLQKFYCRECEHHFTINIGFERMKHNPKAITTAMQLYFSGESLRNTQESLQLLGVQVSYKTIFMWIKKYVGLMKDYADRITPNVSNTWRADEVFIKVRGNMKYLFAVMDDETRFLIAQEVAESKHMHDAKHLFEMAKKLMEKQPETVITDGLHGYHFAIKKALPNATHERHITLRGGHNNNKMERLNGEIRDREKTMRGLKINETPILTGYQLYHNFIRPHESLDGKTPADMCGIKVEGNDKWKP